MRVYHTIVCVARAKKKRAGRALNLGKIRSGGHRVPHGGGRILNVGTDDQRMRTFMNIAVAFPTRMNLREPLATGGRAQPAIFYTDSRELLPSSRL